MYIGSLSISPRHYKASVRRQDWEKHVASFGPLLALVRAGKCSVLPTEPSTAESGKEDDLIWYLLTTNRQNTNGLGRCQEGGGYRGHHAAWTCPALLGNAMCRTPEHHLSGTQGRGCPLYLPSFQVYCSIRTYILCEPSLTLGSLCQWKPGGQRRALTRSFVPTSRVGAPQASC